MLFLTALTYSQESFKKSLEAISKDLCFKMVEKGKKKVVVLFVTDINKTQTTVGKYMADVVSFYIVNNQSEFSVFDRENLPGIAEAKKLIAEGYIDANNAKQLGKILFVETIVVGNYTVLSASLSLTLKALDVNDGFVIAQSMIDLPIDQDAGALLGITVGTGDNNTNKGFNNRPLNSNEGYNNPETVNKNCKENNTGDYCFENRSRYELRIMLTQKTKKSPFYFSEIYIFRPNQTQCFYDLSVGPASYDILDKDTDEKKSYMQLLPNDYKYKASGMVYIEQCKSKTCVIK